MTMKISTFADKISTRDLEFIAALLFSHLILL